MKSFLPLTLLSYLLASCAGSDTASMTAPEHGYDGSFADAAPSMGDANASAPTEDAAVQPASEDASASSDASSANADADSPSVVDAASETDAAPLPADIAYDAYTKVFYTVTDGKGFYVNNTGTADANAWWTQAELIEMAVDALERKPSDRYRTLVLELIRGFVAKHGRDWTYNDYNDDIAWMVIACMRAYENTGESDFLTLAKQNWDAMHARASSGDFGGGLWWKVNGNSKNACINGPGAIGGYLLFKATGEEGYLTKAKDLYAWERRTLFDTQTGAIYDNISPSGGDKWTFTYNTGTFIGIANYLYQETKDASYLADATLAADFAKRQLSDGDGLIKENGIDGDGAAFKPIMFRWLSKLVFDNGLENDYLPWLQYNANRAWANRRAGDDISWNDWTRATPHQILVSHGAMATVQILQVVPPGGETVDWYNAAPQPGNAHIEAEHCDEKRGAIVEDNASGGEQLGGITDGTWARYGQVDFGSAPSKVLMRAAGADVAGGSVDVHIDTLDGPVVAQVTVSATGGWSAYQDFEAPIANVSSVHDVYLVFHVSAGKSFVANLDWFTLQ